MCSTNPLRASSWSDLIGIEPYRGPVKVIVNMSARINDSTHILSSSATISKERSLRQDLGVEGSGLAYEE